MSELVERLRDTGNRSGYCQTMQEAADLILSLQARVAELESLLRPFADIDPEEYEGAPDDMALGVALYEWLHPTIGDVRHARAALLPKDSGAPSND